MTFQDEFGLEVSGGAAGLEPHWNALVRAFLAHSARTPEHLEALLAADPEMPLAQACRGLFCLLLGRRELHATAREALDAARRGAARFGAGRREAIYIDALAAWLDGRPSVTVARMEAILDSWPQDALAMKFSQAVRFILGDRVGMLASIERVLPAYGEAHPARGYLFGCQAFALEEAGRYGEAERRGRQALEIAPDDAWGLHAVAHIFDMTARSREGIAYLDGNRAAWAHCNNFRFHVWWHLALMHLDRGEIDRVLALYDDEIRRDHTDDYRDIANATSLLLRLELEGIAVGDRWEELAGLAEARVGDGCLTFADLHYMLALCGGGRGAAMQQLVRRMNVDALQNRAESDRVMRRPGLDAAKGLMAFCEGRHAAAFASLKAARPHMQDLGGSHAQRDVFERITIEAAIRAGALGDATRIIEDRSRRRGACDAFGAQRGAVVAALSGDAAPRAGAF